MIGRLPAIASVLAVAAVAGACKQQESLVVVALTAPNPGASALRSATVSVSTVTRTFPLSSGLSTTPFAVGVYVPSSVTGSVTVKALASGGGLCFGGSMMANIDAVGGTTNVAVPLAPATGCEATDGGGMGGAAGATDGGGMGGAGGATDGGGSGGSGGAGGGTILNPPSLSRCMEVQHNDPNDPPCDDAMGISNWTIWSLAFSPDGRTMISAGDDGRVKIWSFNGTTLSETGRVLTTNGATFVAFSPNGALLAVGSGGGSVVYNTTTWTVSATLAGIVGHVYDIGFSPDGLQVYSIDGTNIYAHALGSPGAPTIEALPSGPYALGVSPVASPTTLWAAVAFTDGTGGVLNVKGPGLSTPSPFTITSDLSFATAIRFSPDGALLAAGGEDGILNFWTIPLSSTTPVGMPITFATAGNANGVNSLSFSPSGGFLAVAAGSGNAGGSASIWEVATRSLRGSVVPTYFPVSVAFSPNGAAVAIGEVTCGLVMICAD